MDRNFYHGKQADIVAGSANFASLIATDFAVLGLTSAQATSFGTVNTALQNSYTAAITPETRTPVSIEQKNLDIRSMRTMAINLAKIIYATPTVNDAQLVALGLLPRTVPTPIPAEMNPPVLEVMSVSGRMVNVRIHQSTNPESAGKPLGSAGAQVFSFVGAEPPTDPKQYHYEGLATRRKFSVMFPNSVPTGATAWLAAAWLSKRGVSGMACNPVQVTVQGGPVLAEVS
jgi:hypothetical protein